MCELIDFLEANPRSRKILSFEKNELEALDDYNLPKEIINFFQMEGLSTFRHDFFWTTLPQYQFETLKEWGIKAEGCYAFLRTALGSVFYYQKNKIYALHPMSGFLVKFKFDFCNFMNLSLTMDSIIDACGYELYVKKSGKKLLEQDEMFALVPALPLGGSLEKSTLEKVKMYEHHAFLAQLFGNKAQKI